MVSDVRSIFRGPLAGIIVLVLTWFAVALSAMSGIFRMSVQAVVFFGGAAVLWVLLSPLLHGRLVARWRALRALVSAGLVVAGLLTLYSLADEIRNPAKGLSAGEKRLVVARCEAAERAIAGANANCDAWLRFTSALVRDTDCTVEEALDVLDSTGQQPECAASQGARPEGTP
jgi:hypothetical protein